MHTNIYFYSRVKYHNLLIDQFDFLDNSLVLYKIKIYNKMNLEVKLTLLKPALVNSYENFVELLNLEWNCLQRFNNIKLIKFSDSLTYCLVLRKYNLYNFLENCINSIFLNKNFFEIKNEKNSLLVTINQVQWYWFSCHFLLSNFLFLRKYNFFAKKLYFNFKSNVNSINLFSSNCWIPK